MVVIKDWECTAGWFTSPERHSLPVGLQETLYIPHLKDDEIQSRNTIMISITEKLR